MKILLDTHMIIWALTNDPQLPCSAREMINSPDHVICFSAVSIWEIAIKNQKAPDRCPYHEKQVMRYCLESGFEPISILFPHVIAVRGLKTRTDRVLSNCDPFDRLLIAQARCENCLLLSHDRNFENYDETCVKIC